MDKFLKIKTCYEGHRFIKTSAIEEIGCGSSTIYIVTKNDHGDNEKLYLDEKVHNIEWAEWALGLMAAPAPKKEVEL